MALVLSRAPGQAVYLGRHLDTEDLEGSFDLKVVVEDVPPDGWRENPRTMVEVGERIDGVVLRPVPFAFTRFTPEANLPLGVSLRFSGVVQDFLPGRVDPRYVARLSFQAPSDVRIIRDNAKDTSPRSNGAAA
jgi:hypothetical protein